MQTYWAVFRVNGRGKPWVLSHTIKRTRTESIEAFRTAFRPELGFKLWREYRDAGWVKCVRVKIEIEEGSEL